jgi:hypothetical protein
MCLCALLCFYVFKNFSLGTKPVSTRTDAQLPKPSNHRIFELARRTALLFPKGNPRAILQSQTSGYLRPGTWDLRPGACPSKNKKALETRRLFMAKIVNDLSFLLPLS